jgi:hypothetical protein
MSRSGSTNSGRDRSSNAANHPLAPVIRSKLAQQLLDNKPLLIKIGIGVGVFLLWAGFTALYPGTKEHQ